MPDFPRVAVVSADEVAASVWAHGTRILTNLDDVRAARVDNLDVLMSTRLPTTDFDARLPDARAAKIDNVDARLTDERAAKIDNVDASVASRLALTDFDTRLPDTRAAKIENLDDLITSRLAETAFDARLPDARAARLDKIPAAIAEVEGVASFLAADDYPKTVEVVLQELGVFFFAEGIIDLSENVAGETVKVTEALSVVTPVAYKDYATENYTGVQNLPALYVITKPSKYGLKVQMTMETAPAADRAYPYQFFARRIA